MVGDWSSAVYEGFYYYLDILLNGPGRWAEANGYEGVQISGIIILAYILEVAAAYMLFHLLIFMFRQFMPFVSSVLRLFGIGKHEPEYVFLQLAFPSKTKKSAYATEQLHILLRSMIGPHNFLHKLAGWKEPYSLELVASKTEGIRYMIRIPKGEEDIVTRNILSFLPEAKITKSKDYVSAEDISSSAVSIAELRLSSDYAYPLKDQKAIGEHDPIAYITGQMRNLGDDEVVALQIVAIPVYKNTHRNDVRRINNLKHRLALSKEVGSELSNDRVDAVKVGKAIFGPPVWAFTMFMKMLIGTIQAFTTDHRAEAARRRYVPPPDPERRDDSNPYAREAEAAIKDKLAQPLFEVSIRVLVMSKDEDTNVSARVQAIGLSYSTYISEYQSLNTYSPLMSRRRLTQKHIDRFMSRQLSPHYFSRPTIVSSAELSDLYHFPNTDLTKTEDLIASRSRDLPAPLSQKGSNAKLNVTIGKSEYAGATQDIGISLDQRRKHTYVIGKTGTGKTTMLTSAIYQDIVNGKGVAVFDPHGDMFRELLGMIPGERQKDVVVFDPSDRDHPVGLNILDPGIAFKDEDDKHEWITSSVLSVFSKLAEEHQWGPRMEHILRNATLTALQTDKPSLYTLQKLLTDRSYQRTVAKELDDPVLRQFWDKEFKQMGSMQMSSATAPLTHRLGHFITAKMSRHILLQETSTLRIADIMDESKILLINLSKGDIGEDQSFFFGTILTSFIWMAAYQRTKIPESQRKDFFVYVDEFQNFATPQFGSIMSEGRKFHISLIVSHQSTAQIKDKDLIKTIAGNAATMISLKTSPEDEAFILPYMKPELEKGDIVNLPPYHFYMKVAGETSEQAFSGITVPLKQPDEKQQAKTAKAVLTASRKQWATDKSTVAGQLKGLMKEEKKTTVKKKEPKKTGGSRNL